MPHRFSLQKKTVQSLSLSISAQDLLNAVDRMKLDVGETEIFLRIKVGKRKGALWRP